MWARPLRRLRREVGLAPRQGLDLLLGLDLSAAVIGLSLKTGSPTSYIAVEAEYEAADDEDRYNLMLAGRVIF